MAIQINTFPIFGQRDSRWSSKFLGTSAASTIANYGCLITCWADVCKYYGKDTDPDKMNQSLIQVKGFTNGSYFVWGSVTKVYGDITETQNVQTPNPVTPAQFASFDAELTAGRPIIVEVDFNPNTVSVESHFVVIIGGSNGEYTIADPWYMDTAKLERYGVPAKTIQRFVFTNGPIQDTNYKGYDLGNPESMKVAVDCLVDLQAGNLVRKDDVTKITTDLNQKLVDQAKTYEQEKSDLNTQLLASQQALQALQDTEANWQSQAADYENKLKVVLSKFAGVGVQMSPENDADLLSSTVSDYLTIAEANKTFYLKVSETYKSPEAVLEALSEDKQSLKTIADLNSQIASLSKDAIKTFNIFGLIIKIYRKVGE